MHRWLLISVLSVLGGSTLGCSSNLSACDDLSCDHWQECDNGVCLALPGRCDNYSDCADDEFCDDEHVCQGPTRPAASFFDSDATNHVAFEYRGLIMTAGEAAGPNPTLGEGEFEVRFGDEVDVLDEYPYSYRTIVPESYPDEALRNVEVITMGVSRHLDGTSGEAHILNVNAGFAVESFTEMLADGVSRASLPEPGWFGVRDILTIRREWDGASLRRSCLLAEADPDESEIFLNSFDNERFLPGEDLLLWGNVALGPKNGITSANEEDLCNFSINGVAVSRDAYLAGLAQTEPELSCEVPEEFLEPTTDRYATILFLGDINDASVGLANFALGLGQLTVSLSGDEIEADDNYSVAYRYIYGDTDLMIYQSLGSATRLGDDHTAYYLFRLVMDPERLVEMKANGWSSVPLSFEPNLTYATVEYVEHKIQGADDWYKVCPQAIMNPSGTFGDLLVCHDLNIDFDYGEPFQIAALLELTDDPSVIQSLYGIGDECYCYVNTTASPIGCDTFDAL